MDVRTKVCAGVIRQTSVDDLAMFTQHDSGYIRTDYQMSPAFKVGARRYPSHVPYYRNAQLNEMVNQFYDRFLPFVRKQRKRKARPKVAKSVVVPMLKPHPSCHWEELPREPVCEVRYEICSSCNVQDRCFNSVDWLRPQDILCNRCILVKCDSEDYPYDFPTTVDNVIPGTQLKYTGYCDVFRCNDCDMLVGAWIEGDNPISIHGMASPNCAQSGCCEEVKMEVDHSDPMSVLYAGIRNNMVPPVNFEYECEEDKIICTIICNDIRIAAIGDSYYEAQLNSVKNFLSVCDSFVFPEVHMFALSTIPQRSSESLEMANATMSNINNVVDKHDVRLSQIQDNVEAKISDISRQVNGMLPKVDRMLPKADKALDDVSSTLASFKSVLDKIYAWLPSTNPDIIALVKDIFVSLFFAIITRSLTPLIQGISSYALRCNIFADHLTALSSWLMTLKFDMPASILPETQGFFEDMSQYVPDTDNIKRQAASMYESMGTGLCVAISGIFSFVAIMCFGITDLSAASFNSLLNQSSLVGRALVGMRSFKDVFFGIWDYVDNKVCECLYGQDRKSLDLTKNYPHLTSLFAIFKYFHDTVDASVLIGCNRSACELLVKADNMYQGYLDKSLTLGHREIAARLKETRMSVKSLIESAHVYLTCGDGSRIPPIVVYMYGEAGCGKTELSSALQNQFAASYFPNVPQKDLVYSRKAENEYWDGVKKSHKIITYDDVLQIIDSPQKPNPELFEFIRLNNSDPYQVHMSSVKDKASTFISPSFVFATSNVDPSSYEPRSIHSADAFRRRLDIQVRVDVADKFARHVPSATAQRKVPDESKIWLHQNPGKTIQQMKESIANGTFKVNNEKEVYELHVTTTLAGVTTSTVCNYDQLVNIIEKARTLRVAAHSDKEETPHPELPSELNEYSNIFPSTQGSANMCFSTDWLGQFSNLGDALNYLNEVFSPRFVNRKDYPSCAFIEASVVDYLMHKKFSGNFDEDFEFAKLVADITDSEFENSVVIFKNGQCDKGVWDSVSKVAENLVSQCKNAWTRVYDFLKENWVAISAVIGTAMVISGASAAYLCATNCKVKTLLSEGGSLMQLVGARSCLLGCDLCKRIKKGDLNLRVRNRSDGTITFVPSDVRRVARLIVASADACKIPVHPTFALSICEETFTIQNETDDLFSILDCPKVESHQNLKPKGVIVESHQNIKSKQIMVESHQDIKPKTVIVESHQEQKPRAITVESHQDIKPRLATVESHQEMKAKLPAVESHQDAKLKVAVVEGNGFDFEINWSDLCTEASCDNNAQDVSSKIMSKNFVRLYKPNSNYYTHGLFVCGRMLLMPKHLFDCLNGSVDIVSIGDSGKVRVPVAIKSSKHVTRGDIEVDIVICELGASISARKDIISYFPRKNELSSLSGLMANGEMRVFTTVNFNKDNFLIPKDSSATFTKVVDHVESRSPDGSSYYIRQGFEAKGNSVHGDCCAPYIIFNPSSRAKIVGLHCAGFAQTSRVFAQMITQEDIASAMPTTHAGRVSTEFPNTRLAESPLPNSIYVGSVKAAPNPTKSEIIQSPIHGCFPVKTAPASLYSPDENLMVKNALKVTKNVVLLEEELLDVCVHDVKRLLNAPGVCDVEKRILSHAESITGLEGRQYMNSLNRSTSAGFPYSQRKKPGKPGKQTWLGDSDFIVDNPDLEMHVDKIIEKARHGVVDVELGVFAATLKDERRPIEKVRANKTRVFAASNQGLALAIRRYYLAFMEHVMQNRIDNEIGLGVNVYSYDWTRIVNKLRRVGDKVIAGDFSNFDGSLNSQILSRVSEIVTDWYDDDEENGLIRHVLLEYLFNASWLLNGKIFQLNHSQPSGNPLTTLINCLYNMIIFRYVYLLAQRENGFPLSLSGFCANVASVFYGDDSLCCVSNKVCEWFNQHVITRLMAITGHDYTDETKSGSPPPYRSLSEVTFLKRGFVLRDSFWIAPLSKDTIEDMCMWSRKNIEPQEALLQTSRIASFEASLHGDVYLSKFAQTIKRACRQVGFKEACLHPFECKNFLLAQQGRGGAHDSEFLGLLLDMSL